MNTTPIYDQSIPWHIHQAAAALANASDGDISLNWARKVGVPAILRTVLTVDGIAAVIDQMTDGAQDPSTDQIAAAIIADILGTDGDDQ